MAFVLDASTAVAWCFDEHHPAADRTLELAKISPPKAPAILWFELRNAAVMGVRRGRISLESAAGVLSRIHRIRISFAPLPENADQIFSLAERHRLTFYDAAYLELAQRESIELATLDKALARAAEAEGVALVGA